MTAAEQKKLKILGMLLFILGMTWFLVYRLSPTVPTIPAGTPSAAAVKKMAAMGDGSIRLDLLNDTSTYGEAGNKNVFQYRPKPAPPRPPAPPPPQIFTAPPPPVPTGPPPPPPPPAFKRFTYESWMKTGSGKLAAAISDGTNNFPHAVQGEVLLGQYKITRLTEQLVEIEELMTPNRRQTFPKVQQ